MSVPEERGDAAKDTPPAGEGPATRLLGQLADGRAGAAQELWDMVYGQLHSLSSSLLRQESAGHTLQPTALVHEAYLRLVGRRPMAGEDSARFLGVAARAMRQILIDHARARGAQKRGGGRRKELLDPDDAAAPMRDELLLEIDDALAELAEVDPELARLVELRYFAGLSCEQAAQVLDVAPITVKRMWKLAKGWLHRALDAS